MSLELLELAAARLGELLDELVFVGGATVELWITDPAAPEFRPTYDVDAIVEVSDARHIKTWNGASKHLASGTTRRAG